MYKIEFLDPQEFEQLPYKDLDTSLGIADPKISKAFVRKTGLDALDVFTAIHELEHLEDGHEGVHADHFRNGVYYKGFGELFNSVGLPVLGQFLGGPLGLTAGSGLGQLRQNKSNQKEAAKQSQQSQQPQLGGFGGAPTPIAGGQATSQGAPNVVPTTGGFGQSSGGGDDGSGGGFGSGGSVIDRVKGFFSGRL